MSFIGESMIVTQEKILEAMKLDKEYTPEGILRAVFPKLFLNIRVKLVKLSNRKFIIRKLKEGKFVYTKVE